MPKEQFHYGNFRDYRKIDIYVDRQYKATTTWAPTVMIARSKYAEAHGLPVMSVKAYFQEKK